ncbi:hypothetical protein [Amycolatopsis cihanbeyliensis]|uniref:SPW repeat-containing protein n=1 Tax=Amycolatopsis cihanbeyliensis TaxID=1128664 RepID=A0A542CTZ5_AMYCI|nr:hypothetical protein [Amycolatopsis cihanbeyliensis]TQI94292.1 hypothetical protein FB471_6455 [Amycolatopsis cihanbeyliensis]
MRDLRTVLRVDAVASGGLGVLLVALSGVLDDLLGLPVLLSVLAGAGLVVWAAFVGWVSVGVTPGPVREVVLGNLVWVLASVAFAAAAWSELTGLGIAFVLAQAAVVLGLLGLQAAGLSRAATARSAS